MKKNVSHSFVEMCYLKDKSLDFNITLQDFLLSLDNKITKSFIKKFFSKKDLKKYLKDRDVLSIPLSVLNPYEIMLTPEMYIENIQENENFIWFYKKPFVHSHPLQYEETNNCLSSLFYLYRGDKLNALDKVNTKSYDRGLLYRLDFKTKGLMIFVKDEKLLASLRRDFSKRVKKKIYHCLVQGVVEWKEKKLIHHVSYKGVKESKAYKSPEGQLCELYATSIMIKNNCTLLEVHLQEGRRHQIRFQLSEEGYPIVGDELYGNGDESDELELTCLSYQIDDEFFRIS